VTVTLSPPDQDPPSVPAADVMGTTAVASTADQSAIVTSSVPVNQDHAIVAAAMPAGVTPVPDQAVLEEQLKQQKAARIGERRSVVWNTVVADARRTLNRVQSAQWECCPATVQSITPGFTDALHAIFTPAHAATTSGVSPARSHSVLPATAWHARPDHVARQRHSVPTLMEADTSHSSDLSHQNQTRDDDLPLSAAATSNTLDRWGVLHSFTEPSSLQAVPFASTPDQLFFRRVNESLSEWLSVYGPFLVRWRHSASGVNTDGSMDHAAAREEDAQAVFRILGRARTNHQLSGSIADPAVNVAGDEHMLVTEALWQHHTVRVDDSGGVQAVDPRVECLITMIRQLVMQGLRWTVQGCTAQPWRSASPDEEADQKSNLDHADALTSVMDYLSRFSGWFDWDDVHNLALDARWPQLLAALFTYARLIILI